MQSVFKVMSLSACVLLASVSGVAQAGSDPEVDESGERHEKQIVGWIEKGLIMPEHTAVKIKVDSGALTSSMHAVNLETFEHKGKPWVRYDVPVKDADSGELVTMQFERPVFRRILVRGAGGSDRRPVVKMSICMGDQVYEEQFSLRDRGDMTYPVLIGRRTIEHIGLIDVSDTFLLKPSCSEQEHEDERDKQERMKGDESLVDDSEIDQPEQTEDELEAEE